MIAGFMSRSGEDHRAERRRRQEHHLAVPKMRSERAGYILLCEGWGRAQDHINAADGFGDVSGHRCQLDVVPALRILDEDARACRAMLRHPGRVTAPQPDLVALQS